MADDSVRKAGKRVQQNPDIAKLRQVASDPKASQLDRDRARRALRKAGVRRG